MGLNIKKAVQVVVLNDEGNVLCVSRKDNHTNFGLPGGKVETGETDVRAAIRELKEETGLDVKSITLIYANTMYGMLGYTYFAECTGDSGRHEAEAIGGGEGGVRYVGGRTRPMAHSRRGRSSDLYDHDIRGGQHN